MTEDTAPCKACVKTSHPECGDYPHVVGARSKTTGDAWCYGPVAEHHALLAEERRVKEEDWRPELKAALESFRRETRAHMPSEATGRPCSCFLCESRRSIEAFLAAHPPGDKPLTESTTPEEPKQFYFKDILTDTDSSPNRETK